jgi:hypothetical protein
MVRRGMHRPTGFRGGKPEGRRPLGRPRHRWEDNIKMDLTEIGWGGMNSVDQAQDREHWRALVNTVMNVGFKVLTAVLMKNIIFWDIPPCRPLRVNRRFGGVYRLHFQGWKVCLPPVFTQVPCSAYFSTLKMEAICSPQNVD